MTSPRVTPFTSRYGPLDGSQRRRDVYEGRDCAFPTFEDFLAVLRESGEVRNESELRKRPDLLVALFHEWVRQGAAGCVFARMLSMNPERANWADIVTLDHADPNWPYDLESTLRNAYEKQALLVILPTVTSIRHLVEAAANLCVAPNWTWQLVAPNPDKPAQIGAAEQDADHVVVGLRWKGPHTEKQAWPLAFGPFEELPFTRRSPIAAIAMRTHTPLPSSEGIDLAAMTVPGMSDLKHGKVWEATKTKTRGLLGDELNHAARAQATFRAPIGIVDSLMP